jgi:hypothetical protein
MLLSQLIHSCKPRYVFWITCLSFYSYVFSLSDDDNSYFEAKPFQISSAPKGHSCRFISLGRDKNRYAFVLKKDLVSEPLVISPLIVADLPSNKRKSSGNIPPEGYLCNRCAIPGHYSMHKLSPLILVGDCPERSTRPQRQERSSRPRQERSRKTKGSCWFCLSNPNVESHMIIGIYLIRIRTHLYNNQLLSLSLSLSTTETLHKSHLIKKTHSQPT